MSFSKKILSTTILLIILSVFFGFYSSVFAEQNEDILLNQQNPPITVTPEQTSETTGMGFGIGTGLMGQTSAAQTSATTGTGQGWTLEQPLPGVLSPVTDPGVYICSLYTFGLSAAGILAVLIIVYAGFLWMTSPAIGTIDNAKKMISGAIGGLILLLCSYLILNTINPELLKCNLTTIMSSTGGGGGGTSPVGSHNLSGILTNLSSLGIPITSSFRNHYDFPKVDKNCEEAAKQVYNIVKQYNGVITGGYEPVPHYHSGLAHRSGYGLDVAGGTVCDNKQKIKKAFDGWVTTAYCHQPPLHMHIELNCAQGTTQTAGKPQAAFKMNLKSQTGLVVGTLTISTGDGKSISVIASSGRPGHQSSGNQSEINLGPIPSGSHNISLSPTSADSFSGGSAIKRDAIGNDVAYWINGGGAVGSRNGFAIHFDGDQNKPVNLTTHTGPGTSGCIGVISKSDYEAVKKAFADLKAKGYSTIPITVQY